MIHLLPDTAAPGELRFVHGHRASLVIGLLAIAGAVAAWVLMPEGLPRVVVAAMAAAAGVRLLGGAVRRYELVIDPDARRWRRRSGPFFAPRTATGSLDDLQAVALTLRHVSQGTGSSQRSVPLWGVCLEFAGPDWDGDPLLVGLVENDEPAAYRLLEHYARRLRADAVDRTAVEPSRTPWDSVDAPLARRAVETPPGAARSPGGHLTLPASAPSAEPPTRSGIQVTMEGGRRLITLPPHGVSVGTVLGAILGVVVAAAGGSLVLVGLEIAAFAPFAPGGPGTGAGGGMNLAIVGFGGVFALMGIRIGRAALRRAGSREWVLDLPDSLRFGTSRGGSPREWTELPKRAIEEVSLRTPAEGGGRLTVVGIPIDTTRGDPGKAALIRIRTDHDLVRIGWRLDPEGRAWLRDTIAAAAAAQEKSSG